MTRLIKGGYAYAAGGDVYFDVSADEDYGKLCNRDPEQLEAGSRIEVSDRKRNPGDFALWKGAKPGEPDEVQFDSPWGKGRPGWHIECSAMARQLLGDTHRHPRRRASTLQFPHHENELAQSESATGQEFARIWMHNGLLRMGKGKMAGSVGNVWNIADALNVVSGDVLRFFILNTHYRSPIDLGDWDPKASPIPPNVEAAKAAFETFSRFVERVGRVTGEPIAKLPAAKREAFLAPTHAEFHQRFRDFMDDDFNTGGAVGVLFELVTAANKYADDEQARRPGHDEPRREGRIRRGRRDGEGLRDALGLTLDVKESSLGGGDALVSGLMQLAARFTSEPTDRSQIGREGQPAEKGPVRSDRPDPETPRRLGRYPRRPPERHDVAGELIRTFLNGESKPSV